MTIDDVLKMKGINPVTRVIEYPGDNMVEYDHNLNKNYDDSEESFFLIRSGQYLADIINIKYDDSANEFLMKVKLSSYFDLQNDIEESCHGEILILHFHKLHAHFNYFEEDYTDERGYFVPSKAIGVGIAFDVETYQFDDMLSYIITQLQWGI